MSIPRSLDRRPLCCLALAVALLAPAAASVAPDEAAAHLERIARERALVEREAQAAQAACAPQFAVTACVDRVKAERRQRLLQLDRERAVLDEAQRKRRAADRLAQMERREAARAQQQPKVTVRTREAAAPASAPLNPQPATAEPPRRVATEPADAQATTRAAAAARRASEAAAHRSAIEKRNLERAKQRPPAKPLPPPSAASP